MNLNQDQTNLLIKLHEFYGSDRKQFLLSGQAGVGKTTCMRFFIEQLQKTYGTSLKISVGAPTNKATSVLKQSLQNDKVEYRTIYSLLGLRMTANGEFKELSDSGQDSVANFDLVIIDEASMINTSLLEYIQIKTAIADTKLVFIGDREQLPPVNEDVSPIWTHFDTDYELTEVMRHQNSILDFVQSIRGNTNPKFESPGEQVNIASEDQFMDRLIELSKSGEFHSGNAKAIAWRNMTVDFLNNVIRQNNPLTSNKDTWAEGDRIVIREPIIIADIMRAATDQEGTVVSAHVSRLDKHDHIKVWRVKIRLDDDRKLVTANVIHNDSIADVQAMLDGYKNKKQWGYFWKFKESFHNIAYGYALTAHRSQGSTFSTVLIDAGDIMLNRKSQERARCLYVACSRASKELMIFP